MGCNASKIKRRIILCRIFREFYCTVCVCVCVCVYIERLADVLFILHYTVRLTIKYELQQEVFYEEENLPR